MKKQIMIAVGLTVLSTAAFASKARLEALGQDANGSMYLDDARNVFLNPAQLNFHKDFVTLEFGDDVVADDSATSPRSEGGMFKAQGNMVYGLYFGSASDIANTQRGAAMGGDRVVEQNNLDFFIAGDAGVQWGVRLTYGDFTDEQAAGDDQKSSVARSVIGIVAGDIEGYANIGLGNTAEGDNDSEFKGKGSIDLGMTYNMGDMDYIVQVATTNAEDADGDELTGKTIALGAAKTYKLNDRANAWVSAFYKTKETDNKMAASGATGESKDMFIPIAVSMEVMAKDWLTLRGSVTHEVIGTNENDDGDKKTRDDKTQIAAGATLSWGDLALDGMIANTDGTSAGTTSNTEGGNGTLRTDQILSRISLTYKF